MELFQDTVGQRVPSDGLADSTERKRIDDKAEGGEARKA